MSKPNLSTAPQMIPTDFTREEMQRVFGPCRRAPRASREGAPRSWRSGDSR